jgi:hypothetical protein
MIEAPSLPLKSATSFDNLHTIDSCAVAVVYCIYDRNKRRIVDKGTSRACGENHNQISIHAEKKCIGYCRTFDKRNRFEIYIWRYTKEGKIKPVYCCGACSKLVTKYNYHNKIYTFENDGICSAIGEPYVTLGYQIKNNSL